MNIILDDDFVLVSDGMQFILQLRRTVDNEESKNYGNEYVTGVGYYSDLESALKGYVRKKTYKSEATTIDELLQEIRKLNDYIHEIIERKTKGE